MSFQKIVPDLIVSSLAMRAQTTALMLAQKINYTGKIHYMKELYQSSREAYINVLSLQNDDDNSLFLVGHNPELTEFANFLLPDNFFKFPTLGVLAIKLDIDKWEEISQDVGIVDFFIQPKQFKYYMPRHIRTTLPKG